ncbi:DinB family protein [Bacillus sp. H-16]|uniref:DinB family protein n=1 Tax=Alteribacter salitolerans TaxID=2912333 RepID=UPI00196665DE|nr:DinB family protein [Alteribacter salitolerans]MBM7094780.1 DinB family protein [Alteribacter salitolerans]
MKNKTLVQFEKAADEFAGLKEVPGEALVEPIGVGKWSPREVICHMYYWDKFNKEQMVPHMADGARLPAFPDHDAHNAEGLKYLKSCEKPEEVIDLFVEMRKELAAEFEVLNPDMRFTIGTGKRQFSPESFVKMFVKHDQHHLKQLEAAGVK